MLYDRPIRELMTEFGVGHAGTFSFAQLRRWFSEEYPAVQESSLRAHLHAMTAQPSGKPGRLPWLFERVHDGEYRYSPTADGGAVPERRTRGTATIWEQLDECTRHLSEPFSRADVLAWFRQHRPDVLESSLTAHLHAAVVDPNHPVPTSSKRQPFLVRIEHGKYRRSEVSIPDVETAEGSLDDLVREITVQVAAVEAVDPSLATPIKEAISDLGVLEGVRELVMGGHASDVFRRLWDLGRLDLTLEALVTSSTNAGLFAEEVRQEALGRLSFYVDDALDWQSTDEPPLGSVVQAVASGNRATRPYRVESVAGDHVEGREFWYSGASGEDGVCHYAEGTRILEHIKQLRQESAPVAGRRRSEQPAGTYGA